MGGGSSTKNERPNPPQIHHTTPEFHQMFVAYLQKQMKTEETTEPSNKKLEVSKEQLDMLEKLKPLLDILAKNKSSPSELDLEEILKIDLIKPYIEAFVKEKNQTENLKLQESVNRNTAVQYEATRNPNHVFENPARHHFPNSATLFNQEINHGRHTQQANHIINHSANQQNTTLKQKLTEYQPNQNKPQQMFYTDNLSNMQQHFPPYQTSSVPQHFTTAIPVLETPLIPPLLSFHHFPQQQTVQNQNMMSRDQAHIPQYHQSNNERINYRPMRNNNSGTAHQYAAQNNTPRNTGAIPKRYRGGGGGIPPRGQAKSRSIYQGQRSSIDRPEDSTERDVAHTNEPTEICKDVTATNKLFDEKVKPPAFFNKNQNNVKNINNDFSSLDLTNDSKNVTEKKVNDVNEEKEAKSKPKTKKTKKKKAQEIPAAQVEKIIEDFVAVNSESKVCQEKNRETMKVSVTRAEIITFVASLVEDLKINDSNDYSEDFLETKRQQTATPSNMKTSQTQKSDEKSHSSRSRQKPADKPATNLSELELTHNAKRHLQECQSYFDDKISKVFNTSKHDDSKMCDAIYPEKTKNHHLLTEDLRGVLPKYWQLRDFSGFGHLVVPLKSSNSDFHYVSQMFHKTVKNEMKIEKICRLENVFSWLMFRLKKQEMSNMLGYEPHERNLFHGTRYDITPVIEHSLNWRSIDPKYKGVTFSPLASNMSHQCGSARVRHMILARVLIGRKTVGNDDTLLPPPNFNTIERANGKVMYKYDDYTSYPEYLITFSGRMTPLRVKQQQAAMENSNLA